MRPKIYLSRAVPSDCLARLEAIGDLTWSPTRARPPEHGELLAELPGHDVAVVQLTEDMDARVLRAAAPRLKLVSQVAVGVDNIDLEVCRLLGVQVAHTPGVLTDATADLTMALILAVCRRVVEADRFVRDGQWKLWSLDLMCGMELRGRTLGILGRGRIGAAVARRAEAFGMKVIHCSRRSGVPLGELLARADILSIHAPLTPDTEKIIDEQALFSMKEGSVLINTSRGALVEEAAIAAALDEGPLRAAGLDVYEQEPSVHPSLLGRSDVVLLPHIGSATDRTRHRMAELAVEAVESWVRGERIAHSAL
jgi:glyoxylate reductase